ncbi:MAG: uracil-DNA glycosylase family protein [Bacillota bacterium]
MKELIREVFECNLCSDIAAFEKTFYYNNPSPEIGILMQNPAFPSKKEKSELQNAITFEEQIQVQVKYLREWVSNSGHFFKPFFILLKQKGLISYDELANYRYSGGYLSDFYFFDAVKCRSVTKDITLEHFTNCSRFVERELDQLSKIKIIFSFSSRTWEHFKEKFNPRLVKKDVQLNNMKVTSAHGHHFSILYKNRIIYVIPLVHMSERIFNNLLRNSYFDYLEEGLDELVNIK